MYQLTLVVEEAVVNIILHGYQKEEGNILIQVYPFQGHVEVVIRDRAKPFDPTRLPAPQLDKPLSQRNLGGLGAHLMRTNSDGITYQRTSDGLNELKILKKYPIDPQKE